MIKHRSGFRVEHSNELTTIYFTAEVLDELTMQNVHEKLLELVKRLDVKKMLLNFSEVKGFSSTAISNFIALNKFVEKSGGKLVMCSLRDDLMKILKRMQLNKIIIIKDDLDSGLKAFE